MKIFSRIACLVGSLSIAALVPLTAESAPAPKKTKVDTPIASATGATQSSLDITVCAATGIGATGLPAGFSLQWMEFSIFTGVWPLFDTLSPNFCKASFSGNANQSTYNLLPGQCAEVEIGSFLYDENGASSTCIQDLTCGTSYVFRAFGHATSKLTRSDYTANFIGTTDSCGGINQFCQPFGTPFDTEGGGSCAVTLGYWKTHSDAVCAIDPASPLCVAWPVTSLTLGTVSYDQAQLCASLNTPGSGNGLIILAHQLIAAKLNVANGSVDFVASAIAAGDALIGGLVIPPVGSGSLSPGTTAATTAILDEYNNGGFFGAGGPCHCQ